jgi:hypothetical protein
MCRLGGGRELLGGCGVRIFRYFRGDPDRRPEPSQDELAEAYQVGFMAGRLEFEDGHRRPKPRETTSTLSAAVLRGRFDGFLAAEREALDDIHDGFEDLLWGVA